MKQLLLYHILIKKYINILNQYLLQEKYIYFKVFINIYIYIRSNHNLLSNINLL